MFSVARELRENRDSYLNSDGILVRGIEEIYAHGEFQNRSIVNESAMLKRWTDSITLENGKVFTRSLISTSIFNETGFFLRRIERK